MGQESMAKKQTRKNSTSPEQVLPEKFEVSSDQEFTTITLNADLDTETAARLSHELDKLVEQGIDKYRFDLKSVRDISANGISAFIVLSRCLHNRGINPKLEIRNASEDIARLFEMTHLDNIYRFPTANNPRKKQKVN